VAVGRHEQAGSGTGAGKCAGQQAIGIQKAGEGAVGSVVRPASQSTGSPAVVNGTEQRQALPAAV